MGQVPFPEGYCKGFCAISPDGDLGTWVGRSREFEELGFMALLSYPSKVFLEVLGNFRTKKDMMSNFF
ncbi:MAG: hypothetical protein UX68_C0002G0002 [Parcubacteria group bacterium GW2011_GWA2_46_9]|nr:MAG: hypothetical protein UX68_C0002G0002 [Parcubacteria group bacterium GW2011_GWA2_46_9]